MSAALYHPLRGQRVRLAAWARVRWLTLLPGNGLALLRERGIPVYAHKVVARVDRVVEATADFDAPYIMEAELITKDHDTGSFSSGLSGTRQVARNTAELENFANRIILRRFSGPTTRFPQICHGVLVTGRTRYWREYGLSIAVDDETQKPTLFLQGSRWPWSASHDALMNYVRHYLNFSLKRSWLARESFDTTGMDENVAQRLARLLGIPQTHLKAGSDVLADLCRIYMELDGDRFDIKLTVTEDDAKETRLCCTSAGLSFGKESIERHPALKALFSTPAQTSQIDPRSIQASQVDMIYEKLEGDIGCLSWGPTATAAVLQAGGQPSNRLDGGDTVSESQVIMGLKLLRADKAINAILISCSEETKERDMIVQSIARNVQEQGKFRVPLILCLPGPMMQEMAALLKDTRVDHSWTGTLDAAAQLAVDEARRHSSTPKYIKIRGNNPSSLRRTDLEEMASRLSSPSRMMRRLPKTKAETPPGPSLVTV